MTASATSRQACKNDVRLTLFPTPTTLLLSGALLLSTPAFGQKLYRCGNNFSQTPCSSDGTGKTLPNAAIATSTENKQGVSSCGKAMIKLLNLPDTHSADIEAATRGKTTTIEYAGQPMVARTVAISVSVRNALGTKLGLRSATCYLSEDEQRVLKLTPG